ALHKVTAAITLPQLPITLAHDELLKLLANHRVISKVPITTAALRKRVLHAGRLDPLSFLVILKRLLVCLMYLNSGTIVSVSAERTRFLGRRLISFLREQTPRCYIFPV